MAREFDDSETLPTPTLAAPKEFAAPPDEPGVRPAASLTGNLIEQGRHGPAAEATSVRDVPAHDDDDVTDDEATLAPHGFRAAGEDDRYDRRHAAFEARQAKLAASLGKARMPALRDIGLIALAYMVFLGLLMAFLPA